MAWDAEGHYAERLGALYAIAREVLAARSLSDIARVTLEHLQPLLGFDQGLVLAFDFERRLARVVGRLGDTRGTADQLALEDLTADVSSLLEGRVERLGHQSGDLASHLRAPLLVDGELIGALDLASSRADAFTDEHVGIAREVAGQLAIGMHQARLHEQVTEHAAELAERVREKQIALAELERVAEELQNARDVALLAGRSQTTFLARLGRDARMPLTAIADAAERLAAASPAQAQADLAVIRASAKRLMAVMDDVADLAGLDEELVDLELSEVAVEPLIDAVAIELGDAAADNGNVFVCNVAPDVGMIRVDADKLALALSHLLANACQFTQDGRIELNVERRRESGAEVLAIEVTDTGRGIDDEALPGLFDGFARDDSWFLDDDSSTTGLGLTISRRYLRRMGGDISVHSIPGVGSTFTVWLPYAEQPDLG